MINIKMDWTDTGAVVLANIPMACPTCSTLVPPNVEHRCGDRLPQKKKKSSTEQPQDIKEKG